MEFQRQECEMHGKWRCQEAACLHQMFKVWQGWESLTVYFTEKGKPVHMSRFFVVPILLCGADFVVLILLCGAEIPGWYTASVPRLRKNCPDEKFSADPCTACAESGDCRRCETAYGQYYLPAQAVPRFLSASDICRFVPACVFPRSEEHTSELQSPY